MVVTDQESWSEGRSETPDEAYRAGAELSKIFAAIDEFYVDGAINGTWTGMGNVGCPASAVLA